MTEPHPKFAFETVFDQDGGVLAASPRPRRMIPAEEVEGLRLAAFQEGERSAVAQAEEAAALALGQIAEGVRAAMTTLVQIAHGHRVASAQLALAAAAKIADAALERFPEAPAAAALTALAREVDAVPRLVVRAVGDLVERLQTTLDETAAAVGYPGQITVKADPDMPLAAFILDWGDGRAAFDPTAAAQRVAEALQTALAADGLHGEPLNPRPETDHG